MRLGDARRGKFADNLLGFGRLLRRAGLPVDSARIALAQEALELIDIGQRPDVHAALQTVLVSRQEDQGVFDELFADYFRNPDIAKQLMAQLLPQNKVPSAVNKRSARAQEALQIPRTDNTTKRDDEEENVELDAAMTASDRARLRHADFNELSASEFKLVERLAREMPLPVPRVASRRRGPSTRGGQLHWARLMRMAGRHDGEILQMPFCQRRAQPLPLLILVDVSGSMERYARLMLAFLHQATRATRRSVFAFGTELTDLNSAFALRSTDQALAMANDCLRDFGGGTRMGEALRAIRDKHRREILGNRTVTLLISDGLDTGEPALLKHEIEWLQHQCRAVVWLNPLLRYDRYQPLAGGAQTLIRHVDAMLAIHNLSHLSELAKALAQLLRQVR